MLLFRVMHLASIWFTKQKHPLQVVRAILWNSFPEKALGALLEKMSVMVKLKLLRQGSNIFLEHFQLFQNSHTVDVMQITSSDL